MLLVAIRVGAHFRIVVDIERLAFSPLRIDLAQVDLQAIAVFRLRLGIVQQGIGAFFRTDFPDGHACHATFELSACARGYGGMALVSASWIELGYYLIHDCNDSAMNVGKGLVLAAFQVETRGLILINMFD